ncbi:hypothetical protein EV175_001386 [Coemansia sp. RSA 1933]|nr:hypothetical protein EV175_001386 [Coemansia sp. RSA 1933]
MLELLDDMWLVFQGTLGQWGSVERVEFMLSKQFKSEGLVDLNEMPKKLADQVVAVFPGAHMLTSSSRKDNVAGIAMINSLVDVYSDRLCRLAIDVPALCKALQFPQKLTHLTLDFEHNDIMQLPHIYSSSLLYLSVNDVPEDLDWMGAFGRESGINDNILVFNNLKSLSVSYRNNMWRMEAEETGLADTHMRHTLPFKLVFPRLDTLAISMCPSRGGILQFSEFPVQGLKQLEFGKTIYSDISLVDVRRPIVVDRLVICAAIMQTFDRRDPVHVYNSIMDKVKLRECGTTTIIMPFGCALTEPRQARWPNLTKLELYEPAPSSMVLDLVPRLPSLKKLSVHYLIVDTLYKLNDNDTGHSRGILSYSLRELFLDTYDTGEYESLQKTVCYMIALVPQLVVVTVPEAVRPAMRTFIANSKVTYGHLSAVII